MTKSEHGVSRFETWYSKHYKKLTIITVIILLLACAVLAVEYFETGDVVQKGVTLSGGVSITAETIKIIPVLDLQSQFEEAYSGYQMQIHTLSKNGVQNGYIILSDMTEQETVDAFKQTVKETLEITDDEKLTIEVTGSSLGARFFYQMISAIVVALVLMSIVIYLSFKKWVPSVTIVCAVIIDMIVTLAIFNLTPYKLSSAGIAAFLMIIGYAVDTNILLSTRVLKETEGSIFSRMWQSMKTGLTMTATTAAALIAGLLMTNSDIIFQIMFILLIGLLVDLTTTWLLNAGIVAWYAQKLEKRGVKRHGKN